MNTVSLQCRLEDQSETEDDPETHRPSSIKDFCMLYAEAKRILLNHPSNEVLISYYAGLAARYVIFLEEEGEELLGEFCHECVSELREDVSEILAHLHITIQHVDDIEWERVVEICQMAGLQTVSPRDTLSQ